MKDKYKEPITFTFSNMVARVYIPILDEQERKKRLKAIHKASAKILKGVSK